MDIFFQDRFEEIYKEFPISLIDIGASGGMQTNWESAQKHLTFIGFEPDPEEFKRLKANKQKGFEYFNAALLDKKSEIKLNLTKRQQTNSIYKPNLDFLKDFPDSDRFEIIDTLTLEVSKLDDYLPSFNFTPDFIKLEAQGAEYQILKGATATLENHIFGLELGLAFVDFYRDEVCFAEVDSFMRKQGFFLFDIQRYYWKRTQGIDSGGFKGQIIFGNFLYMRKPETFFKMLSQLPKEERQPKVLKALSICLIYGYNDFAIDLLETCKVFLETSILEQLDQLLKHDVVFARKIPFFRGKDKISRIFHWLGDLFNPSHNRWCHFDKTLGNKKK